MLPLFAAAQGLPWVKPALIVVALSAVFLGGWAARGVVASRDVARLEAQAERAKAEHAAAVASAASAALSQSEEHRATESALRRRVQEADHALANTRRDLAAAESRARRADDRVLHAANAYTCTATGSTAGDPAAAGGDRAPGLGDLLGPVLQDYRAAVGAAEDHAAGVRALLAAWPVRQP